MMTTPRTNRSIVAGVVLAVLAALPAAVAGGYAPNAFFGLRGIEVVVETLDKDSINAGLTEDRVTTAVLLRLRKAGIPVLTSGTEQKGNPYLYVRVSGIAVKGSAALAYMVEVRLKQDVLTERESPYVKGLALVAGADTGTDEMIGYAGRSVFVGAVIDQVEEYVDKFALAYVNAQAEERRVNKKQ